VDKIELESLIKAEQKKAEQKAKEEAEATEESEEDREGSEGEDAEDSDYTFPLSATEALLNFFSKFTKIFIKIKLLIDKNFLLLFFRAV